MSGPGGIGYGDGDDATVVPNDGTLYLRIGFEVDTPEDWAEMGWAMDYDDGYIAYLNGEEIQRSPNLVGPQEMRGTTPMDTWRRCCSTAASPTWSLGT